jgi:hypothetical protein
MPVSPRTLSTLVFVASAAVALPAAAVPMLHYEGPTSALRSATPGLHLAARKGTRNFRPDDAGAAETPATTTTPQPSTDKPEAKAEAAVDSRTLEGCMATWDKGTHISKSRWREICQRNANDRGQAEAGAAR